MLQFSGVAKPPTGTAGIGSSTNQQVEPQPDTSYISFSRFKADKVKVRMSVRMSQAQIYSNINLTVFSLVVFLLLS